VPGAIFASPDARADEGEAPLACGHVRTKVIDCSRNRLAPNTPSATPETVVRTRGVRREDGKKHVPDAL